MFLVGINSDQPWGVVMLHNHLQVEDFLINLSLSFVRKSSLKLYLGWGENIFVIAKLTAGISYA